MSLIDAAKYRWEFMRRNKEYQDDYSRYMAAIGDENRSNIQKEMAQKWVLLFGEVHDPKMPFDKIHIAEARTTKQCKITEKQNNGLRQDTEQSKNVLSAELEMTSSLISKIQSMTK